MQPNLTSATSNVPSPMYVRQKSIFEHPRASEVGKALRSELEVGLRRSWALRRELEEALWASWDHPSELEDALQASWALRMASLASSK